jgi:multicomponent Na+:H+ antiporter subunit D
MIILFSALPLFGAFLIPILGKVQEKATDWIAVPIPLILLVLAAFHVPLSEVITYRVGSWFPPFGILLVLDGFSLFMLIVINLLTFVAALFSVSYMTHYTAKWKFYSLLMLMLAGMNGILISGDMFNVYVFLEIASIASYALVAFGTEHEELEAAFKYMVMGSIASVFILFSIAMLYSSTSTLNMADMSMRLAQMPRNLMLRFVQGLLIVGFALKAAAFPFHTWLPDAHPSAPAPISAILSGIFIKTLGVYLMARVMFSIFGMDPVTQNILIWLGLLSMVVGGLLALNQRDIKRLLACSSISQVGYILFALGIGSPWAIMGALVHLFAHALGKGGLFLTSGSLVYRLKTRNLDDYGGLSKRMPYSAFAFTTNALSISGVPPMLGFFGKLFIIIGAIQAGKLGFAIVAILVGVLTLAYFLKVERAAFFGTLKDKLKDVKEAPFSQKAATVGLAVLSILLGVGIVPLMKYLVAPAQEALMRGVHYAQTVLGGL